MDLSNRYREHFDHKADMGVRGVGDTLDVAFEQAAMAMTAVISAPENIDPITSVQIQCEADDPEILLVDWLNGLIYEMATQKMLFSRFDVEISGHQLKARAWGEAIDCARHQPAVEIKGATYTALRVWQNEAGQWVAETVVDV